MDAAVGLNRAIPLAAREERFYVRMAVAFVAAAVIGFAPTYWLPLFRGTLSVTPLAHVHALLFYGWTLLFLKQTTLVASGRVARHREWGLVGVSLATAMLLVGEGMALISVKQGIAAGQGAAARAFAIVPATAAPLFFGLFAAAIWNVRKPETHKRLLIVATASILQAAAGRWVALALAPAPPPGFVGHLAPPPVAVSVLPGLIVDLLIVAGMVHDRRTRGRVHPVYWIAGGIVLAVQLLRVPLSTTSAWMRITDWALAFVP